MIKATRNLLSTTCVFAVAVFIHCIFQASSGHAAKAPIGIIHNGGYMVLEESRELRYREHDLFIPASTLKILTCLVALERLGKGHRFETHFFLDEQKNLYIKGYGDPFLTSEAILMAAKKLSGLGIFELDSLYLDDSSFSLNQETAGSENSTNPYDAPSGALAVNFNALPILVGKDGTISSGEPETPVIPMIVELGARLGPGFHRVNVNAFTFAPPRQLSPVLRYAGELFSAQLKRSGIRIQNSFSQKTVPLKLRPLYVFSGKKSLKEIVRECLKYSNNFIANQLFLACGAKDFGLPATWRKSRQSFDFYTRKELDFSPGQFKMEEGSGLSRNNRISPAELIKVLDRFKPYNDLLPRHDRIPVKTGTLEGVFCYAGYFPEKQKLTPFAILLNQPQNSRKKILERLQAKLRESDKKTVVQ